MSRMLLFACLLIVQSAVNFGNASPAPTTQSSVVVTATTTLTSPSQASAVLSSLYSAQPVSTNIVTEYIENGLTTIDLAEAINFVESPLSGEDNDKNDNVKNPQPRAYPKTGSDDAPYDLTEEELRNAIYIPSTFRCGAKGQPVVLVPGTGSTGYQTFKGNYIPLLQDSTIADPVWLNIPGFLEGDIQTNAEYVAYAINYIYGICHQKVAVIAWSQGNIDSQWAYKYWPSTRSRVTDHIALSPDYHGTTISNSTSKTPVAPASLQQAYNSKFIEVLRSDGGDAAYVPTTTIYSSFFDEIIIPQQGRNASGYLLSSSSRGVAASNNEVQSVCAHQPAGSFYTHEGILYNPLGFFLLQDALDHDGPGQASRLDLRTVCGEYLSPGLSLEDFQLTENNIVIAAVAGKVYPNVTIHEPPIKPYAQK